MGLIYKAIEFGYNMTMGGDGGDCISEHPNRKEINKKRGQSIKSFL